MVVYVFEILVYWPLVGLVAVSVSDHSIWFTDSNPFVDMWFRDDSALDFEIFSTYSPKSDSRFNDGIWFGDYNCISYHIRKRVICFRDDSILFGDFSTVEFSNFVLDS